MNEVLLFPREKINLTSMRCRFDKLEGSLAKNAYTRHEITSNGLFCFETCYAREKRALTNR